MAYRNITGLFGHEWISEGGQRELLRLYPDPNYRILVEFDNGTFAKALGECSRTERNVDRILIYFVDGTGKTDPDPFKYDVNGVVDYSDVAFGYTGGANLHFLERRKTPSNPEARNHEPEYINRVRSVVREKLVGEFELSHLDKNDESRTAISDVNCYVNNFDKTDRAKLLKLLANCEVNGVEVELTFHIRHATVEQLEKFSDDLEIVALD